MDVGDAVAKRLERIGELEAESAARTDVLGELRLLVGEAEAWVRDKVREEGEGMR